MPRIRSSTLTEPFSGTNILLPCIRQARSLTGSSWLSVSRPDFSIPYTMYAVISFVMDDGGIGVSASLSSSVAPVL